MTWEPLAYRTPTARREHTCQLCEWPIPAGSTYICVPGLFEGEFWTYRAHPICGAVLTAVDDGAAVDEGSPEAGAFRDLLRHVEAVEMAWTTGTEFYAPTLQPVLTLPDESIGWWVGDAWAHGGESGDPCPRCGR